MIRHYHVGMNMPGCLPESDPVCADSAEEAATALRQQLATAIDIIDDDALYAPHRAWLDSHDDAAVARILASDGVMVRQVDDGAAVYAHWIESVRMADCAAYQHRIYASTDLKALRATLVDAIRNGDNETARGVASQAASVARANRNGHPIGAAVDHDTDAEWRRARRAIERSGA